MHLTQINFTEILSPDSLPKRNGNLQKVKRLIIKNVIIVDHYIISVIFNYIINYVLFQGYWYDGFPELLDGRNVWNRTKISK